MKLYEYMGKELFKKCGIPVPVGKVYFSSDDIEKLAARLENVVIKAQVLSGKRGKAGGIKFACTPKEAQKTAEKLLKVKINNNSVSAVLVEERLSIEKEYYAAITVDGTKKCPLLIVSASGGVDIEDAAEERVIKLPLDIHIGMQPYIAREAAWRIGMEKALIPQFTGMIIKMYQLFRNYDCELVEINPLAVCDGRLIAVDAKITVDDEARFRCPADLLVTEEITERERKARDLGISYVELDGDIAVIANGAGITMATLDLISHYGGKPRNFMDVGGGATTGTMFNAIKILLSTGPKVILANFFGGITRCNEVAGAFAQVKDKIGFSMPVIVRLSGTNDEEGMRILERHNIKYYRSIDKAVIKAVGMAAAGEEGSI